MLPEYHRQITINALSPYFGGTELEEVIEANLAQDNVSGQIGHPEFHFDDSEFARTYAYLASLKTNVIASIATGSSFHEARADIGRFTHASQDFYAHSNYIRLWARKNQVTPEKWNGEIDFMDQDIINSRELISGHFYTPWEMITFIPYIGHFFTLLFPKDSHAALNIDSPKKNAWFPLAFKAAELRTRYEIGQLLTQLYRDDQQNLFRFLGKSINPFRGV
jgi:hypothetical protein